MKRLAMALALLCALSTPIFAGNMPTGGFVDPPPPPSQLSETQSDTTQSSETIDIQSSETETNVFATVLLTIVSLI